MESLPLEVITHIFRFLPTVNDRKAASLVCKLWYQAYQNPIIRKYEVLDISSNDIFDKLCELQNPKRFYYCLVARGVEIKRNTRKFWDRFGPHLKSLSICSCDLREKSFINVILRCDDLESLCIQDCRELFMYGHLLEEERKRDALKRKLHKLKRLNLGYNRYLSDATFVRLTSICENLQELLVPGCYISFHGGLYKKFYRRGHSNPSENVFTFPVIFDFIKASAEKLKILSFSDTLIDNDAINSIAQTEKLALRELNLRGCLQVTNDCIMTLSNFQLSLTHLDISLCPRITDLSLLTICSRLTKLKYLSIQGCRAVTDLGISDLWRLTELSRLNISECERVHDEGMLKGLCTRQNKNLEELNLSHLADITDNLIVQIIEFIPNIRVLDLGYCYNAVTDRSVQSIFSKAKRMKSLTLTFCEKLTDRGLTGISPNSPNPDEPESSNFKIPLGSNEEKKIVRDAKLKQDVEEMCETIGLTTDLSGSSLNNLEYLENLNLSGCSRISDVSLKYSVKLEGLRSLDLSCCQQITAEGISHVCKNNKAIEFLNLDNCHNVNDVNVFNHLKKLGRLKSLILGSNNLMDNIVDCFDSGWENLRLLDVRNCSQLSGLAVNKIMESHPRLNVMHFSTKCNDFQYMFTPPLPFPPPLIQI